MGRHPSRRRRRTLDPDRASSRSWSTRVVAHGKPTVVVLINGRPLADPAARREGAGDPRRVVRRPGRRHRHRRGPVRRRQPGRQAPGHAAAQRRPAAGLLQPQADVVPRLQRLDRASRCSRSATASATRRSRSPRAKVEPAKIRRDGTATVTVEVTNTGARPATKSCSSTSATWSAR